MTAPMTSVSTPGTAAGVARGEVAAPAAPLVSRVDAGAEDLLRAIRLVTAAGGEENAVQALRIGGDPWSKSRPRHTYGGRTYQPPQDRAAEAYTRNALRPTFQQPMTGNVALAAIFYRPNRQRIDADNMLKHVCDSATGIAWHDDCQATAVLAIVELDPGYPRTVLAFAPHRSTLGRGTDWTSVCVRCEQLFIVNPKHTAAKYCGKECSDIARGHVLMQPIPCPGCGQSFRRATTEQKYCSLLCARTSSRGVTRPSTRKRSACLDCGKALAHNRGGRCRECWKISHRRQEVRR